MAATPEQFAQYVETHASEADAGQRDQLAGYLALVAQYSPVLNLTGFGKNPERLAEELVGEAVRLLNLGPVAPGLAAVDLGSGNGSPVVPLAVLCPRTDFLAVESRQRRAAFLMTVKAKLGLDNLTVRETRVEQVAAERPRSFDLLTSRAFAPPDKLLKIALSLVCEGGEVRGFLGDDPGTLSEAASGLGLTTVDLVSYEAITSWRHVYLLQA